MDFWAFGLLTCSRKFCNSSDFCELKINSFSIINILFKIFNKLSPYPFSHKYLLIRRRAGTCFRVRRYNRRWFSLATESIPVVLSATPPLSMPAEEPDSHSPMPWAASQLIRASNQVRTGWPILANRRLLEKNFYTYHSKVRRGFQYCQIGIGNI